ncbi:hypothetical protein GCM10009117_18680 [Gangjinia marincola]|uniref:Secretion system C-terminal sorting domain-containing protein n=1 Tax=Gangjinia marincola TaxID=578463 RepID=A0ABP3XXJ9_9FLAO
MNNLQDGTEISSDLWKYDHDNQSWTDFSSKMPDEPGGDSAFNDPFSGQGGYDLVVSVKPDNENFVLIGGSNAYRIENIESDPEFLRIGGYLNNSGYALYNTPNGDEHHPDIHAYEFNPFNFNELYSGTDGGVHLSDDITANIINWQNLNNNYQTYQFYHVGIDPAPNSNIVIGGAQDNGTVVGGTQAGNPNNSTMFGFLGGDGVASEISRADPSCGGGAAVFAGFQNGRVFRSCNSFVEITPNGSSSQFVTYFRLDNDNQNHLLYAARNRIYATFEASDVTQSTWDNKGNSGQLGASDWWRRFNFSPGTYTADSYLLAGGDEGLVIRLDDPQNNDLIDAVNITPSQVNQGANIITTGLAIHPTNPDIVLLTYSNYGIENIFLTTNATSDDPDWTVVERNLADYSIRSAVITEVNGETRYFVGTARGLFATNDPTTSDWEMQAPDLIGMALVSDLQYRQADQQLLIGTHGNGMFMATVEQELDIQEFNAEELANISLFPNPATTSITIDAPADLNESAYRVIDLSGKTLEKGVLSTDNQVNVSSLSPGVYFLSLGKNTKTLRFIKR